LISVREACRLLSIGNTSAWTLIKSGRIQTRKIGRRRLIVYSSVLQLIGAEREPIS
jgi:excisionase family DNA binding protein